MPTTVNEFLEASIKRKLDEAEAINTAAEKAARPKDEAEKAQIARLLDEVNTHRKELKELDDNEAFRKSIEDMRGPVVQSVEEGDPAAMSIGEAFTKSEAYERVRQAGFSGDWKTGPVEFKSWNGGQKATVSESASAIVQPDVQAGILPILNWPLRVADLFAPGTTDGNTVRVIKEATNVNAAAGTAEAGQKPESTITFSQVDFTVGKITTFLPVTDEMLEDVSQMRSYLDNRLSMFVKIKEDSDLLNGAGTPTVTGLLQNGSIQTGSALALDVDSVLDAIFQAMTLVSTGGLLDPDAIVMHPTDWAAIKLMKDQNKQYYGGGPFTGAYGVGGIAGKSLWDLPVVVSTSIAAGTVLVGAFKQGAQIFRRSGLTVDASNSHSDWFQYNKTAIRAEERLALAVYRPQAFYALTGANLLEGS